MLIGAHVSPAGGPANAVDARGGARLPRDPDLQPEPARLAARVYSDEEVAAFHEAIEAL